MPRPRPPPTPLSSTDITAQDISQSSDVVRGLILPPPAINSSISAKSSTKSSGPLVNNSMQNSPPQSPEEAMTGSSLQRKRTLSGGTKTALEQTKTSPAIQSHTQSSALPPPPTRARKIIQMKPKQPSATGLDPAVTQTSPTSSKQGSGSSTSSTPKRGKQPSATSAAGRKIARKTAHSIIERRRRSKMNEEFGVLKDMIPACTGIEMHKLAILQAGIEYLKYLEGCVEKLKAHPERVTREEEDIGDDESMEVDSTPDPGATPGPSSSVVSEESSIAEDRTSRASTQFPPMQHNHRASSIITSSTNSAYASPDLRPINSSSSVSSFHHTRLPPLINFAQQQQQQRQTFIPSSAYQTSSPSMTAATPLHSGVSPAFNAFHLSPDLTRSSTWGSAYGNTSSVGKPSPHILPLPQAALPLPQPLSHAGEGHAEATATAALMMLTNDRRASVSMARSSSGKGMSVKDLLSS